MRQFYVMGRPSRPEALIRHSLGEGEEPYSSFDPVIDDFVPEYALGQWIINGDTILTAIPDDQVEGAKRYIRVARL